MAEAARDLRVQTAILVRSLGAPIIPLRGKIPAMEGWTEVRHEHQSDDEVIALAERGNIGMPTGAASGIVVVELDLKSVTGPADQILDAALAELGLAGVRTLRSRSGGGGIHVYLRQPAGVELRNTVKKLHPLADTRAAGGQIVLPGSIHPDTKRTYEWLEVGELAELPPALLARWLDVQSKPAASLKLSGDRPAAHEAQGLLEFIDPGSKQVRLTQAAKKAKKEMADSGFFDAVFNGSALAQQGARHDTLCQLCGDLVARLHGFPWSSPALLYALALPVCDRLGDDEPFADKAWKMIVEFWAREDDRKIEQAKEVKEQAVEASKVPDDEREMLLLGARDWNAALPADSAEAVQTLQDGRYGIAMDRRRELFYVMKPDGFFDPHPCCKAAVPKVIDQKKLGWLVPTALPRTDERGETRMVELSPEAVIRASAREFATIEVRFDKRGCFLDRDEHGNDVFCLVPFRLRDCPAERVPEVERLWREMFGPDFEEAATAIGMLLAWNYGPTAAVTLWGRANGGKSLLALALADCVSTGRLAPARALVDNFNATLLRSPIIHFEEGADKGSKGIDAADALRRVVTGGPLSIEQKGQDSFMVDGVHRIYMSANSTDILTRILGDHARSEADWEAIAERVALFHVRDQAQHFLTTHNQGWVYTKDWIGGRGKPPGKYARFLMWIFKHVVQWEGDRPKMMGKRLLYEGRWQANLDGTVQQLEAAAGAVPEVACAINRLLGRQAERTPNLTQSRPAALVDGEVFVLTEPVIDAAAEHTRCRRDELRSALKSLVTDAGRPYVLGQRARWQKMDGKRLLRIVRNHTEPCEALKELDK